MREPMATMLRMAHLQRQVEPMSDDDLTDAVIAEIWAKYSVGSRESALLDELLTRFLAMRIVLERTKETKPCEP